MFSETSTVDPFRLFRSIPHHMPSLLYRKKEISIFLLILFVC